MLKAKAEEGFGPATEAQSAVDIDWLLFALRRQALLILACLVLGLVAGYGFYKSRTREYTAISVVLLDSHRARGVQDAYEVLAQGAEPGSFLDTQAEIIKSDPIGMNLIDRLHLLGDPELDPCAAPSLSRFGFILGSTTSLCSPNSAEYIDDGTRRRKVIDALKLRIEIKRVPRTPMLEISYRSSSPEKAAAIANGIAEAFLSDSLQAKYEATTRATKWLQERLGELKEKVITSDLALQKFKADNDLISANGRLVKDQQLSELNTQLGTARAETAKASSRYKQVATIRERGTGEALLSESIADQAMQQLRTKYLLAAKREAELSAKLGPSHEAVLNARREMADYQHLMFNELGRLKRTYKNEMDVALERERSISQSLAKLVDSAASSNTLQVNLRELEREAETYKNLYQTVLQKHQELLQQQSFPITESRQTLSARVPESHSHPKRIVVLGAGTVLGLLIGIALAGVREFLDRGFRTAEQISDDLRLECLALVPALPRETGPSKHPVMAADKGISYTSPPRLMRHIIEKPFSAFAEAMGSVKIATDIVLPGNRPKKIGVISCLPGEGKTLLSYNLGLLFARVGAKTLLIDADLRNPQLTRLAASNARVGLLATVIGGTPIAEALLKDPGESLSILPAVLREPVPHTWAFLTSPGMRGVIEQAEAQFDVILFDLPPMGPVSDAAAFAPNLDAVVLVVEWGKTSRQLVRSIMQANPRLRDRCLGVLLNKVDLPRLKRYDGVGSKDYYSDQYSVYRDP